MTTDDVLTGLGIEADEIREVGPVRAFRAGKADLVPLWRRLRTAHDRSGLWPFLIGPDLDEDAGSFETRAGSTRRPRPPEASPWTSLPVRSRMHSECPKVEYVP